MTEFLCLFINDQNQFVAEGCLPLKGPALNFDPFLVQAEDVCAAFRYKVSDKTLQLLMMRWMLIRPRITHKGGYVIVGPEFASISQQKNGRNLSKIAIVI